MTQPGDRLRRLAARVCGPETMARLIDPIVADLQTEDRAAANRAGWRRRAVIWRGYLGFWKALALYGLHQSFRPSNPEVDSGPRRVLIFSALAFGVMTALMVAPPMIAFKYVGGAMEKLWLMVLLVPQALPLSIPTGICIGIVCAMRGRRVTGRHVAAVLMIAAVATLVVWTMLEWGVAAANEEFREAIAARLNDGQRLHLEPGLNELGLSRLSQRTDEPAIQHSRLLWAICFATGPVAIFALGLAGAVRRLAAAVVVSMATLLLYWSFLASIDEAVHAGLSRTIAAWLPNLLFLLAGAIMLRFGSAIFRTKASSHELRAFTKNS